MNATEKGRQLWNNFVFGQAQQAYKQPDPAQWREAFNKALEVVRRLAPEMTVESSSRITGPNGVRSYEQGMILQGSFRDEAILCCANTFVDDPWVPGIEKALTFYLYYRLFPDRFRNRPEWHRPIMADPVGILPRNHFILAAQQISRAAILQQMDELERRRAERIIQAFHPLEP